MTERERMLSGQLYDAGAVSQIHKIKSAQIPLPLYPAAYGDCLSDMAFARVTAGKGAGKPLHCLCHY